MIKKIIGWIIVITICLGIFALEVVKTMNELQCSLLMAIAATSIFLLAIIGITGLLILALNLIFD